MIEEDLSKGFTCECETWHKLLHESGVRYNPNSERAEILLSVRGATL